MLLRLFIILITYSMTFIAHADGVSLNQSRIIYSQKDKSQVMQVHNDTASPILVQTSILDDVDGKIVDNFILTPRFLELMQEVSLQQEFYPITLQICQKIESQFFI